jgi:hypothetical protein
MRQAGAGWIRVDFNWSAIELRRGSFDWGHLDAVVNGARCHGLRVLALPAYTPTWARPRGTTDKYPPTDPARFADFVVAASTHFGDRVAAWELWNEPDLAQFWSPRPDAAAYGQLLRAAAVALRAARPAATILTGGLAPMNGRALTFLGDLLDGGGFGPVDGVAMHPYTYPSPPSDPDSAFNAMTTVHDLLVQRGLSALKVWATEIGAPTGRSRVAVNDGLQSVSVTEALRQWQAPEWRPWTGALFWYSWRDIGTDTGDPEQNFGLLRVDGSPKPALAAYRQAVAAP